MKYPAYPRYKPSGVEWLGKIPEHWELKRIKHFIQKLESGVSVNSDASPAEGDSIGVLKTSCVYGDVFDPNENKRVSEDEIGRVKCPVQGGTLIISRMNTPELVGCCGYVEQDHPSLFLPDRLWIARFNSSNQTDHKFFWYLCISSGTKSVISSLATGTSGSMKNIGQDDFLGIAVAIPPIPEQNAIVAFLDKETLRIDLLVRKKRELLERLKEKRTALISRTVTRGLPPDAAIDAGYNPNPPLKPSRIEWLGEIPAHWEVQRLDRHARVKGRLGWKGLKAEEYVPGGYIFLATPNIKGEGPIDFDNVNYISEERYLESPEIMLQVGDVLIAKDGSTLGITNVVRTLPSPATVNSSIAVVRPKPMLESRYLFRWFSGKLMQALIHSLKDGQGVPHLFQEDIRKFPILMPPLPEQLILADYLDQETAKLDGLTRSVEAAINCLHEYRTGLITAAVSGKIDVRNCAFYEQIPQPGSGLGAPGCELTVINGASHEPDNGKSLRDIR